MNEKHIEELSYKSKIQPFKDIIQESMYPTKGMLKYAVAKNAIRAYRNTMNDDLGVLELMVFYVECANQFTVDFGDIDENFYIDVETMFEDMLELLKNANKDIINIYLPRLRIIVSKANGIGWCYYDNIKELLDEVFPE